MCFDDIGGIKTKMFHKTEEYLWIIINHMVRPIRLDSLHITLEYSQYNPPQILDNLEVLQKYYIYCD